MTWHYLQCTCLNIYSIFFFNTGKIINNPVCSIVYTFVHFVYIHICIAVLSNYQEGESWYPIDQFNPATFLCLFQTRYLNFQHMSWSFLWSNFSRWEVIVWFVDIGGIAGHHCLNLLFFLVVLALTSISLEIAILFSNYIPYHLWVNPIYIFNILIQLIWD